LAIAIDFSEDNINKDFKTPLIDSHEEKEIIRIASINPYTVTSKSIKQTGKLLESGKIKGLKIYLGYLPFYPNNQLYHPFYRLAGKYNVPVIFHTGDTYSQKAKIKYSKPLSIDEVAVEFPQTNFIIAHLGNPWLIDAAEIILKNPNVYADLSGFIVGRNVKCPNIKQIKEALEYCGYEKILYGSDWPLVPMNQYIRLIKKIVPKQYQNKVFYENAKRLFKLN
jgi:predicted TIM-barrel fold metal-dependent hydrolase